MKMVINMLWGFLAVIIMLFAIDMTGWFGALVLFSFSVVFMRLESIKNQLNRIEAWENEL